MTDQEINEKMTGVYIKVSLIALMLFMCFADTCNGQVKPRLDTVQSKVIFTDEKGIQYDVFKSDKTGKSYIVKNGSKLFLFRRERS